MLDQFDEIRIAALRAQIIAIENEITLCQNVRADLSTNKTEIVNAQTTVGNSNSVFLSAVPNGVFDLTDSFEGNCAERLTEFFVTPMDRITSNIDIGDSLISDVDQQISNIDTYIQNSRTRCSNLQNQLNSLLSSD